MTNRNKSKSEPDSSVESKGSPPRSHKLRGRPSKITTSDEASDFAISCQEYCLGKGAIHEAFLHTRQLAGIQEKKTAKNWDEDFNTFVKAAR